MHLSPRDIDKLMLHQAGALAQKRYARGLQLNYAESVALIAAQLLEFIRDGESVATLMDKGKRLLGFIDVLPGVAEMVEEVQIEGTFPDGTKLVTVHHPICAAQGQEALALYASGLKRISIPAAHTAKNKIVPGEYLLAEGDIALNVGREILQVTVTNVGDRPIQVGSHYPFFETNAALKFDREKAFSFRLNIPSGTAVRFEPGETKTVELVAFAGERKVYGGNALISGALDDAMVKIQALKKASQEGFMTKGEIV